jgi:aminoglycoside phosphotransferase (APT) family kinase protein
MMPSVDREAITADLVSRLIATQFPRWADLPVRPVEQDGWDNRTFHLGLDLSVRLPSGESYALQVAKEHRWLPVLAPQLPLPIPAPVAMGEPGCGYPWPWSVYRWLPGEPASPERVADLDRFAGDLAGFLAALYRVDATGGPRPGAHNFFRGGPLTVYDTETRDAIALLGSEIEGDAATRVWEAALSARWTSRPHCRSTPPRGRGAAAGRCGRR